MRTLAFKAALFAGASVLVAGAAHAGGTNAGTSVENTFTLDYEVGSVEQGTITNDPTYTPGGGEPAAVILPAGPTEFTVDRLVDLTVTADTGTLKVAPGTPDTTAILSFTLRNLGNDYHSYSFEARDVTGDEFDASGLTATYSRAAFDLNGDSDTTDACEAAIVDEPIALAAVGAAAVPGVGKNFTCDIPPDMDVTITLSGTIPQFVTVAGDLEDGDLDNIHLVAQTRNPTAWVEEAGPLAAAVGAVTANDDGTNVLDGVAEVVWADGQGVAAVESATPDGLFAALSAFEIIDPDLTAEKTVQVLETASDAASCLAFTTPVSPATDTYAAPGACIEYTITVTNTADDADADAEDISITDILSSDVEFVSADHDGFDTTPAPTVTSFKTGTATACDGALGEQCEVTLSGATLSSQDPGDAEATLTIRALVR